MPDRRAAVFGMKCMSSSSGTSFGKNAQVLVENSMGVVRALVFTVRNGEAGRGDDGPTKQNAFWACARASHAHVHVVAPAPVSPPQVC